MVEPAFALFPDVVAVTETERRNHDAYFTTPALAANLVHRLESDGWWRGGSVLEPSAGRGAFVLAAQKLSPAPEAVHAYDVDPVRIAELDKIVAVQHLAIADFLTVPLRPFSLVIGNPPFGEAIDHVGKALKMRSRFGVVAFLLRLAFLETAERAAFWAAHPASKIYVLSQRPSFTGGGTDNSAYGFFVWASWHRGPTELEVISWR